MNLLTPTRRSVLGLGLVTLALVPAALWALFSGFVPYDDEGTMLVTLAGLSSRGAPYTDFYSQYGPFWLEVLGGPFAILHRPLTDDSGRLVVLAIWLATAASTGVAVRLLTGRLALAMAAVLCAFEVLEALADEPMHPSSLVALLLAAAVLAALAYPHRPRAALAVLGGIVAALALTKINVGALLLVAVLYGLAVTHPRAGRRTRLAAAGMLVILPVAVLAPDLGDRGRAIECAVTVAGLLAVVVCAEPSGAVAIRRPLAWLALGGLAVALPVLALPLFLGTSPADLLEGVLIAPTRQRTAFSVPLALPHWTVLWAIGSLVLAVIVRRLGVGGTTSPLAAVARLLAGGLIWAAVLSGLPSVRAGEIIGVVVPLAWVAALPPHPRGTALARAILPAAAITETLQAYPVAGTQVWIGLLLFVVVGAVCIGDGLTQLHALAAPEHRHSMPSGRAIGVLAAAVLLLLTTVVVARSASDHRDLYASSPKLALHGATRMRAAPDEVRTDQAVVRQLRRRCSALITMPGMHSFDVWSGLDAPSGYNTTHWWSLLTRSQQLETVARARRIPDVCVLRNDSLVDWWSRSAPAPSRRSPLVRFIDDDFATAVRVGPYRLLKRRRA